MLIGIGGVLAFAGKPTTAVVLGGVVVVGLWIAGRRQWRGLLLSVTVAASLLAGLPVVVSGPVSLFVEQFQAAAANAAAMSSGYSLDGIQRPNPFELDRTDRLIFAAIAVVVAIPSPARETVLPQDFALLAASLLVALLSLSFL